MTPELFRRSLREMAFVLMFAPSALADCFRDANTVESLWGGKLVISFKMRMFLRGPLEV
jgi:hypothetical protein